MKPGDRVIGAFGDARVVVAVEPDGAVSWRNVLGELRRTSAAAWSRWVRNKARAEARARKRKKRRV